MAAKYIKILRRNSCFFCILVYGIIYLLLLMIAFGSKECDRQSNVLVIETDPYLPYIYFVTPTHKRQEQYADMVRLSQTLMHIRNLKWIVVEDSWTINEDIDKLIKETGIDYIYMPAQSKEKKNYQVRGRSGRMVALSWIRAHVKSGVLYFGDDDNTYHIQLFDEMRYTKKISMWPVGLVTDLSLSSPIVRNNVVVGFYDGYIEGRAWPVDFAGFALNIELINKIDNLTIPGVPGLMETQFLEQLGLQMEDIEIKADGCKKVLVWHTQTEFGPPPFKVDLNKFNGWNTNLEELAKWIERTNPLYTDEDSKIKKMVET